MSPYIFAACYRRRLPLRASILLFRLRCFAASHTLADTLMSMALPRDAYHCHSAYALLDAIISPRLRFSCADI